MIIGYARVSSTDQKLSLQHDALQKAGCEKIFDDQMTGSKKERPGLDEALNCVRAGDTLVVWRLDRLSRSLKDLIQIVTVLKNKGVNFQSIHESVNTNTPTGDLVFHIFGALAEFERVLIIERTKAGLASARARGMVGGRPVKLSAEKIKKMQTMYDSRTFSVKDICKIFDISKVTFYRYIVQDKHRAKVAV